MKFVPTMITVLHFAAAALLFLGEYVFSAFLCMCLISWFISMVMDDLDEILEILRKLEKK